MTYLIISFLTQLLRHWLFSISSKDNSYIVDTFSYRNSYLSTLDPKQYKEAERQRWDGAANNWQTWWKPIESGSEKVSSRLIELAEIEPGSRVLDIATGIGEPAITAANQVGKMGHVLATDISPQMLSVAKQRAISFGLQDIIDFKAGDIETIDLPSSAFDAVLCRWGLMLLPDLNAGLSNIYEALAKGGHFAASVWAFPAQDTLISTTMNIVMKETNSKAPPPGTPGPFSLSDEDSLKTSFTTAGFKDPAVERMGVTFDFDSASDYTTFISETVNPLPKLLASQTLKRRREILEAITESAKKYADNKTENVSFKNDAILIVGKK
jgi:ubiquinone/menaquinone biosynthesis C-methylase UbiE